MHYHVKYIGHLNNSVHNRFKDSWKFMAIGKLVNQTWKKYGAKYFKSRKKWDLELKQVFGVIILFVNSGLSQILCKF